MNRLKFSQQVFQDVATGRVSAETGAELLTALDNTGRAKERVAFWLIGLAQGLAVALSVYSYCTRGAP